MVGGDFNARIGDEGIINWENSKREIRRKTRDKIKNAEGRIMLELIEEEGWSILNGNLKGDDAGEWTYIGSSGNSVIDYGIVNAEAREDIENFVVEERIESDHLPIRIDIYSTENGTNPDDDQEETSTERRIWTEEGKRNFAEKTEEISFTAQGIDEMVEELTEKLNKAVSKKTVKVRKWRIGTNKWWDKECTELKRVARRALKKWRKGEDSKDNYEKKKKKYKDKCKEKKTRWQEREEQEIQQITNENQVWEYINRGRKKRTEITKKIETDKWKAYFMQLLEGTETPGYTNGEINETAETEENEEK